MDIIKHASLFNPLSARGKVIVVGVGALGSALAIQLAKLGLENLHFFDDDSVEAHNIPNQILYGPQTVGWPKVQAAQAMTSILTGYEADITNAKLVGRNQLPSLREGEHYYFFVAVDSMSMRKHLFEKIVYLNPNVALYVEGRMNTREGMVHAFRSTDLMAMNTYKDHLLYPDSEVAVERGACGNILSIGATANSLACDMTWALINACNGKYPWQALNRNVADGEITYRGPLR